MRKLESLRSWRTGRWKCFGRLDSVNNNLWRMQSRAHRRFGAERCKTKKLGAPSPDFRQRVIEFIRVSCVIDLDRHSSRQAGQLICARVRHYVDDCLCYAVRYRAAVLQDEAAGATLQLSIDSLHGDVSFPTRWVAGPARCLQPIRDFVGCAIDHHNLRFGSDIGKDHRFRRSNLKRFGWASSLATSSGRLPVVASIAAMPPSSPPKAT